MSRIVRAPGNYDEASWSNVDAVADFGPSLTQQSQKEDADINTIVKRFGLTGQVPNNVRVPSYGDFMDVTDYKSAMDAIRSADSSFNALPAHIRIEFDNDPGKFVDFASDPANIDALREMGLAIPKESSDGSVRGSGEAAGDAPSASGAGAGGDKAVSGAGAKGGG